MDPACENSHYRVFFQRVEDPSGDVVPRYLIVAPKRTTGDLVTGVAILPVIPPSGSNEEERFALLKVYRPALSREAWEVPRGFVETSEDEVEAIRRELEEETGMRSDREAIRSLGYIAPEGGVLAARIHLFAAACRTPSHFIPSEVGHRELRCLKKSEMDRLVAEGQIEDPSTLITYLRYVSGYVSGYVSLRD